jgi:hypothetical protein
MKGNQGGLDSLGSHPLKKPVGEVKSCRGGSNRSIFFSNHRLIAFTIQRLILPPDVGRKGNVAYLLESVQEVAMGGQANPPSPILYFLHLTLQSCSEVDSSSRFDLPRSLDEDVAFISHAMMRGNQKNLARSTRLSLSDQAGRENPAIIHHQEISGLKIFPDVLKGSVFNLPAAPMEHHQTAVTPLGRWVLGDQGGRKGKIEFLNSHRIKASLDRQVPLDPALKEGVKGHHIKGKYLTGKPRPLGHSFTYQENNKISLDLQEEQEEQLTFLKSSFNLN